MRKGRFGILYAVYAIAAFLCVILKMPLLCGLIAGFAIAAEQDEWAGRQTIQAFSLSAVVAFFGELLTWAASLLPEFYFLADALRAIVSVVSTLVYAVAVVFSILGILRVMKGQEANLPLLSELAYKAYGKIRPRPVPPVVPGQYFPPYGQPQPPAGKPDAAPAAPVPPAPPAPDVPPEGRP